MRVVRRTHQRPAFHVPEAHLQRFFLQEAEFLRLNDARDREVVARLTLPFGPGQPIDFLSDMAQSKVFSWPFSPKLFLRLSYEGFAADSNTISASRLGMAQLQQ